ncbi:hypothetical protein Lfu02_01130 [Longispora fulva]|uniref:Uncharacterized protein n=1 Tax=Longispora fulva TaxID=619741 RepID=A0A8J7GQ65_9ACTN|nr:hypothetical protein [Longispora fulva]MBG6136018.1 hypothetical protein [Longispora fulva]GIG55741.1 hypothetical protein Lfu02_01130 [Longispora fulva]
MNTRLAEPAAEVVSTAGMGDFRDPPGAGVLAVTTARRAVLGHRWLGTVGPARSAWWTRGEFADLTKDGLQLAKHPDAEAVVLIGPGTASVRVRLAVAFARHLAERPRLGPRYVPITSPSPVPVPGGAVCVAHLVTVGHGRPAVDTALWEITTPAREYLRQGVAGPDPAVRAWVDTHAHQLAGLRNAARTSRLPRTPAGRALAALLDGQPLTVPFACVHSALLADVLRSAEPRTP